MNNKVIYTIVAIIIIALVAVIVVKNRGGETAQQNDQNQVSQNPIPQPQPQAPSPSPAVTGCPNNTDVTQTDANGRFKPTIDISNKTVTLNTNFGTIKIQLYDKDAPKTVENFVCLVQRGYYNNLTFHRVAHGFVIQGGDPTGTGSGGSSVYGVPFADELYPDTPSYKAGYVKGVVAMANAGPNTNTSQFFIMLADIPAMPHNYSIFGKVSSGQDVVDKIGAVPVTDVMGPGDGTPKTKIIIKSATVK